MIAPVLCWDIDGTLLTTERAGVYALEKAALEVTGQPVDLQRLATAGLTDVEIARRILQQHGVEPTLENQERLLRLYEDALPESLPRRQGWVMPGVRPILEALAGRPDWGSILLTGNTRRGARAKLEHYGLAGFFAEGAFSDGTENRREIAEAALALIRTRRRSHSATQMVVIGDTPHDIACAKAVGARSVAVATGGADMPTLQQCEPNAVLRTFPSPGEFFAVVERVCSGRIRKRPQNR
jgi:phosphoglycolate phosphatase-like HAD superfamily hydrolase